MTDRLDVTFVAGISESARTPEGRLRLFPGGSLVVGLEQRGIRTTTLAVMTRYIPTSRWRTRGYVGSRGIPLSPRFLLDLVRSRSRFFICREYGVETLVTLVVARLRGRKALVFQEHVGRAQGPLSGVDMRYRRMVGRLAAGFIANTPAAAEEIVNVLRVPTERVFQVMTLVPPRREELRRVPLELGEPRARPLFLFVGELVVRKNAEGLLRAARILLDEGRLFEVWIAGEGSDGDRLRQLTLDLGLDKSVRFVGPIGYPSIGHAYEACDVFVMPSHADVISVAVLEALRFGKPVICSAGVGALGVVAHDGVNAFTFDPTQPSELAERMRRFIAAPELAAEMGARSDEIMAQHTPEAAAEALVGVLCAIAPVNAG